MSLDNIKALSESEAIDVCGQVGMKKLQQNKFLRARESLISAQALISQ